MVESFPSERFSLPQPDNLPDWLSKYSSYENVDDQISATRWGNLNIVTANFGQRLTNEDLLRNIPVEKREDAQKIIAATGITMRYMSPPESDFFDHSRSREKVIDDTGRIGAYLLHQAIEQSSLHDIPDHLIVSNLDLPVSLNSSVLTHAHLNKEITTESIRAACGGGLLGFIKALNDRGLRDKTIAILALEPTGHLRDKHHMTAEHIAIPSIFTDMYSVMILRPSDFDVKDYAVKIIRGGGIKVQTSYTDMLYIPNQDIPEYLQGHIEFNQGDESLFHINEHGMFLEIDQPDSDLTATMDASDTAKHFTAHGIEFITNYIQKNPDINLENVFVHQPSAGVIAMINRKLQRMESQLQLPFDLQAMNTGNGTSAVTIRHLQHILDNRKISPTEYVSGFTMGIGSVFAGITFRQKAA